MSGAQETQPERFLSATKAAADSKAVAVCLETMSVGRIPAESNSEVR